VASGGAARATECCVLNPNIRLHAQGECNFANNVETCSAIEKASGNKQDLLSFLQDEVPGTPFPKGAFVYVCPIDPNEGPIPTTGASFVKTKDGVIADVTQNIKFFAYFDQLIWQGAYDVNTQAEKSKDEFPIAFQVNGTFDGTTDIRLVGYGHESYNAKPIADDDTQKVSAKVSGNVVGDPGHPNQLHGVPVLVEGHPVCTTSEVFDRAP
jgi:hypothetical protein